MTGLSSITAPSSSIYTRPILQRLIVFLPFSSLFQTTAYRIFMCGVGRLHVCISTNRPVYGYGVVVVVVVT